MSLDPVVPSYSLVGHASKGLNMRCHCLWLTQGIGGFLGLNLLPASVIASCEGDSLGRSSHDLALLGLMILIFWVGHICHDFIDLNIRPNLRDAFF